MSLKVTRQWSEVTRPLDDCQTTFFRSFKQFGKILKKVTEGHATVVGGHATVGWLSNNVFWRFKQFGNFLKKVAERSRDSGRRSRDRWMTVKQRFLTFQAIRKIFEKSHWRSRDSGRRSRDRWMTVKQRFLDVSSNSEIFWKKSLKVTRQWSEVTRPLYDCQTTFFDVSSNSEKFWKSHWRSRDSGRRSRDRWMTVKQLFFQGRFKQESFFEKSHWMVTRQWSEVTRPSADCQTTFLGRFKQFGIFFEKSHWTVTRQWSEVTRPLADCQTTFFWRFKQFGKFLKKVTERSRDSGRRSRDRWMTVKQRFLDVSSNSEIFWKKSLKVTRQWSEVTRPLDDCQTTFFWRFKQFGKILKKVTEGHATVVGGHATVGWLSNNVFWRFKHFGNFLKKVTERSRDSGRRSRDRRPTVKQRFFKQFVSSNLKFFLVVWKNNFGHWTVTRQWSEVTRPSADCQTTFFGRFKQFDIFWKKSLNGHATVVGGHATVGRLSNNVFWTFQAIWNFFEKSHWTVTRQWSEVTRPSADCQAHICMNKRERERERERDYLRYTSYGHRHVVPLAVSSAGVPVEASSYTGRRSAGTASLWIL